MASNYQPDPANTQPPASAPSWTSTAAQFLLSLPAGTDVRTIESIVQAFKVLGDYAAFCKENLVSLVVGGLLSMKSLKLDGTGAQAWVNSFGRGLWVSVGDVLFSNKLEVDGATTLAATEVTTNLTVDGHIIGSGLLTVPPTVATTGTGCTVSVSGSDIAGKIVFTVGATVPPADFCTLTFGIAYGATPKAVLLTSYSAGGTHPPQSELDVSALSTTAFTLHSSDASTNITHEIFYQVIG